MTVALFEAPATDDGSSEPTLLLAASSSGPGWRTAVVEVSAGGHRFAERTARRKSVLGRTISVAGPDARTVDVQLIDRDQWLLSCDAKRAEQGCNLAMLGGEMIQFRDAEAIGPGRFRLRGLRRGIGRLERPSCTHRPGELFLLLERDGVKPIDLPPWADMAEVAAETLCGSRAVLQRKSFQSRSKLTERRDSSIA